MIPFDGDGRPWLRPPRDGTVPEPTWGERRFDAGRNWWAVESLLSNPSLRVQWIFISEPLERRLLDYAETASRPDWLVRYAELVMLQPSDAAPHDDHFHVRVYCSRADRAYGCEDSGPIWQHEKKVYKYPGPEHYDPLAWRVERDDASAASGPDPAG